MYLYEYCMLKEGDKGMRGGGGGNLRKHVVYDTLYFTRTNMIRFLFLMVIN